MADPIAADPIVTLVASLREGRAPPLAWCVEFAPTGRIDRAWALTTDPVAMKEILGAAWTGSAWLARTNGLMGSPVVQAGIVIGIAVLFDTLMAKSKKPAPNEVQIPNLALPVTAAVMPIAIDMVQHERGVVAQRVRELNPVPPTLRELFERYGVGTHAKK